MFSEQLKESKLANVGKAIHSGIEIPLSKRITLGLKITTAFGLS